jgi:hypothetical protein
LSATSKPWKTWATKAGKSFGWFEVSGNTQPRSSFTLLLKENIDAFCRRTGFV